MEESFLLEELKWMRNRLTVLIEIAEKDKPYQSEVAKKFGDRIKSMETKTPYSVLPINDEL